MATRTLEQVIQETVGIGRKEAIRLSSFLGRDKLKSEFNVGDAVYGEGGILAMSAKIATEVNDKLTESGREMLSSVQEMMKDSVGKNATETREILLKMKVLQETLGKATDEQSKAMKKVVDKSVETLEGQGGMFAITKEVLAGRVEGFKDKMIRKIPLIGGILGDIRSKRRAAKLGAAKFGARLGGAGTAGATISPSEASDIAGEAEGGSGLSGTGNVNQTIIMLLGQIEKNTRVVSDDIEDAEHEKGSEELEKRQGLLARMRGKFGKARAKIGGLLGGRRRTEEDSTEGGGAGGGGFMILGGEGLLKRGWQATFRKGVEGGAKAGWMRRLIPWLWRGLMAVPILGTTLSFLGAMGAAAGGGIASLGAAALGILASPVVGVIAAAAGGAAAGYGLYKWLVEPAIEAGEKRKLAQMNLMSVTRGLDIRTDTGERVFREFESGDILSETEAKKKYGTGDTFTSAIREGKISPMQQRVHAGSGVITGGRGLQGQTVEQIREHFDQKPGLHASELQRTIRWFNKWSQDYKAFHAQSKNQNATAEQRKVSKDKMWELTGNMVAALEGRVLHGRTPPFVTNALADNPWLQKQVEQKFGWVGFTPGQVHSQGGQFGYSLPTIKPMPDSFLDNKPIVAPTVSGNIQTLGDVITTQSLAKNAIISRANGVGGDGGLINAPTNITSVSQENNTITMDPTTRNNEPSYLRAVGGSIHSYNP